MKYKLTKLFSEATPLHGHTVRDPCVGKPFFLQFKLFTGEQMVKTSGIQEAFQFPDRDTGTKYIPECFREAKVLGNILHLNPGDWVFQTKNSFYTLERL